MELTLIAVIGVVAIVAVAAMAERMGVAAPLVLVVVGVGLSFLPGLPHIEIDPEIILTGVLPPLLYAAATRMPATDFRRDLRPISGLAIVLVALTTLCCGYLFNWLLAGLGLAAAFALGAIISPTDAVAATAVGKRLGLPSRLLTILEGEGLVNDASSLVLLASAVTAITATVHLWHIGLDFVYSVALAVAIGFVIGHANVIVRSWLDDAVFNTAVSFTVPFIAFLPAEALNASGILAVVVTGLVSGHEAPRRLRARDRLAESVNWATVAFLLESGIFLVMGLQLKTLLDADTAAHLSASKALWVGLIASVVAVVLRVAYVVPLVARMRRNADRAAAVKPRLADFETRVNDPDADRRIDDQHKERLLRRLVRKRSDVEFYLNADFGWRGGAILAWSGMRGAVTVAAAQTLPTDTPYRPQLLLIAFTVAVTTLLVQGLSLPAVIRALHIPGDDNAADRSEYATLLDEMADRVRGMLDDPGLEQPSGSPYADGVLARVSDDLRLRTDRTGELLSVEAARVMEYRELMLRAIALERSVLLSARSDGTYSSRTLLRAQRTLDVEEARMQLISVSDGD